MIIRPISKDVFATDKLRPQFLLSEVKSRLASIGMTMPKQKVTISIVNRAEFDRLLKHHSNAVTGLTVTHSGYLGTDHHIYMLNGMSTCRYKETLAHECGHVWLNDRHSVLNQHSRQEVEGFCNLVAYKVLMFDKSQDAAWVRQCMLSNPDPIYGEGFRIMKQRAEQMGWRNLLASYS